MKLIIPNLSVTIISSLKEIKKSIDHTLIVLDNVSDSKILSAYKTHLPFRKACWPKKEKTLKKSLIHHAYSELKNTPHIHVLSRAQNTHRTEEISSMARGLEGSLLFHVIDPKQLLSDLDALILSRHVFDTFQSKKTNQSLTILVPQKNQKIIALIEERLVFLRSLLFARSLVETPASEKKADQFVEFVKTHPWKQTHVTIYRKKELEKLGCGLLLGVNQGSDHEPALIILETKGKQKNPKIGFVGKGLTFDAGGLQIKNDKGMDDMKCDMAGAASVLATMLVLDQANVPFRIVGALALTENLLGPRAYKPHDILLSHLGKTVEISHTDAEGRLVLADAMSYIIQNHKPEHIVTIATLTGACLYALGYDYAGVIGNDKKLISILSDPSITPHEQYWELPLDKRMIEATKGEFADLQNSTSGYFAGASMGAAFLSHFAGKTPFTHIDIAGTAYRKKAQ
jgi:leucyl aminopeptidase